MNKGKRNNITIKIVSVLIAVIMWSYVMSEVNPIRTQEFPGIKVNYLNQNSLSESGLQIMEPIEATISVKLTGRISDIKSINPNDIIAQVDLWGYSEGLNRVPVEVKVPENVSLESTNPKYIQFKMDSIITKEHKVFLRTTGKTEDGYTLGEEDIRPSTVLIKGPRSWVNLVSKCVATVELTNITSDIKTSVPIRAVDDSGNEVRGIEKEPNTVEIGIVMLRTKNISVEPRIKGAPLDGYEITDIQISPANVMIKGRGEILKDIEFIETEPIDVEDISASKEVSANIVLPEGVELMGGGSKTSVSVKVEKIVEKDIELNTNRLTFINLNTRLYIDKESLPETITLTVRGTESIITELDERDVTFYVDLSGLELGIHNVNIKTIIPDNVELININPDTIQLNIKDEV